MASMRERVSAALRSFRDSSSGSVTVEFVLWVPVFLGLLLLSVDTSLIFMHQSNFWNVSRDTARIVSRHGLDAIAGAAYARSHVRYDSYTPDVSVQIDQLSASVIVTISGQAKELAPFGILGFVLGDTVTARVTQALEPI